MGNDEFEILSAGNSGQVNERPPEIVFDASGGFSPEEQQEILDKINAATDRGRLVPDMRETAAAKKGIFFPLCVNIGALVILLCSFILLFFTRGREENAIRESASVLGATENALIREIRLETTRRISEKEHEINAILSKLSAADAEYRELQLSLENMSEAQEERSAGILLLQDEYQRTLSALREEKASLLEDARMREAAVREGQTERAGDPETGAAQGAADIDSAMEELRRLGSERERVDAAESQTAAFYALVNGQIAGGRYDEAYNTFRAMREFLDAPSLKGIPSFETRKLGHLAAIEAMEETLKASGSGGGQSAAAAERRVRELEQIIAAYDSGGSEQGVIIAEQRQRLNSRDEEIGLLRGEAETLNEQMAELNGMYEAALRTEAELNTRIQNSNNEISQLSEQAASREELLASIPGVVEDAIEVPAIQDLLGPGARQEIVRTIQEAIQRAVDN